MKDNHKPAAESPFRELHIGSVVTRYREKAKRIHHARFADAPPKWFTPDKRKDHGAMHRDGFSVYWESELDLEARTATHPFETEVVPNAVQQLSLL